MKVTTPERLFELEMRELFERETRAWMEKKYLETILRLKLEQAVVDDNPCIVRGED